jgi:hypothetical protein
MRVQRLRVPHRLPSPYFCNDRFRYAALLSAPVSSHCGYINGQLVGFQAAVASMASSVRRMLTGGASGGGGADKAASFDYDVALEKFGALAYVAAEADLSQLALANIRPAVTALASRSSSSHVSLLLLLKWGQGSKNRHFVDVHCHATALPPAHDAAAASPTTIDAYAVSMPSLSSPRSSASDGSRTGIRLSWLDAGVDLS